MDFYEPLSSGEEEEELEPILTNFPPVISNVQYTPLDNSKNEIRLLELIPAQSSSSDVQCQLAVYSLDNDPTYSALSYTWGNERLPRGVITVNNHSAIVMKNLFDALHRLREDGVQKVWVDALCINQNNEQEKAYQVQKMGMIYQSAWTVLSWIGPEDEDSDKGIQVMRRIAALSQSLQLQSVLDPYHHILSPEQRKQIMEDLYGGLSNDSWLRDGDIMLAHNLTHREYWSRLWVIQELCLARSATILCGASRISWDEVQRAMAVFSWLQALSTDYPSRSSAFADSLSRICRSYSFRHWKQPPAVWVNARIRSNRKSGIRLLHLLDDTCNDTLLKAHNPRDRVYALLGLACEDDQNQVIVDYTSPVSTVFASATLLLLQRHGARVLMYSGLAHRHRDTGPLPSWVIDWSCTRARAAGLLENPLRDIPSSEAVRVVGHNRLALRAAIRTRVVACDSFFAFSDTFTTFLERVQHLMQAQRLPSRDLVSLKRTVWRTLLHSHYPPSLSVQEIDGLFDEYLENDTAVKYIQSIAPASYDIGCQSAPGSAHEDTVSNDILTTLIGSIMPASSDISHQNAPRSAHEDVVSDVPSADHLPSLRFKDLLNDNKHPRSLFVTEDGSIGSGPVMTKEGDILCAFPECNVPFLLQSEDSREHGRRWEIVAPVYVEDMVATEGDGYFTMKDFWATNPRVEEIMLS